MRAEIKDIAYYLPENIIDNNDLQKENPDWNIGLIEKNVGVSKRHIAGKNETALDLAFQACKILFSKNSNIKKEIDGIIFCTQSEDYIMPPDSCILHKMLDLSEDVFAVDFNLACSGYIYGLALAKGLIYSNIGKKILLVNADTYSKYINKQDRSVRTLFGDGAAVSLITLSEATNKGIIDIQCATSGKDYDKFIIPAGGCRLPKSAETAMPKMDDSGNIRTLENINMNGMGILVFVNSKVPQQIKDILTRNDLAVDDISLFIFHQASKVALDSLMHLLNIKPDKIYRNLSHIGNTVSASIPIALKDALEEGRILPGDKVLLSGFGAGLSWGTAIIEI